MKKRRTFDLDLPEDELTAAPQEESFPAGKTAELSRRSPMAAAITENAESLRERRHLEAEIRAENDALAAEHVRLKRMGLITDLVPLEAVETWKLVRDRSKGDDQELTELIASIRDLGLSNPIRVEAREDGRYELIQGFRRLQAYKALLEETGDAESWGRIPAGILPRGEGLEGLYRRMVDENLVRKDISFAEMAQLALNYAADPGTKEHDPDKAVAELFQSAGYQKRSYIRQFIRLMARLGEDLKFAAHIPRALGLRLVAAIDERPDLVPLIRAELKEFDNHSVPDELDLLKRYAGEAGARVVVDDDEAPPRAAKPAASDKTKTTFQLPSSRGRARCTAANGRLEVKLALDFTSIDRRKLEGALQRLLQDLA